ncbi:atos homolog protein A isoform 1-T1 [Liasis olivaceus]
MVYSGNKGLHREDTLDEYFEYEAEEFLVNLALLITEGRTPEYSIKGRTEGFHCPPAQSSQPITTKHECSDKLVQCRQARHTRSEVALLWKNNIPIMIEVMLLPDCCYSDEGPTTEGNDLNDPAIKQDALLLERWILEPVPRQSGDRFIEEKTLLLAVRSFVFFSQLSAWLSVSHGAAPRNILYRVSAAHVDLQWTFSQTPTEHLFPVPNVSHNVALKVSVQSLPRQSNYPVLTCSIHTNFGFYEKRREEDNVHQHCDSVKTEPSGVPISQRSCGKLMWAESVLGIKQGPEFSTAVRNLKLYPLTGLGSDFGSLESKVQCYTAAVDSRALLQETSERALKSSCLTDIHVRNGYSSRQSLGDSIPLIGSLLQERHEVIARIAQHLIHCDPAASPVTRKAFSTNEIGVANSKALHHAHEEKSLLKKGRELSSSAANLEHSSSENVGKAQIIPETPLVHSYVPVTQCSQQAREETNPLISSLLQERQEVITRIAQHLTHCDPPISQVARPAFSFHDISAANPKAFHGSCEEDNLLKKNKEVSPNSFSSSRLALSVDKPKTKIKTSTTLLHSLRYDDADQKVSPNSQFRKKPLLVETSEVVQNTFHQSPSSRSKSPLTCMTQSCSKEGYKSELTDKLESVLSGCPHKPQVAKRGIAKQCSHFSCSNELVCRSKFKDRTISCENSNPHCSNNPQLGQYRILENVKMTTMQTSDSWHKYEPQHLNKESKQSNICEQNSQLTSIENYLHKDHEIFKCKSKQDKVKNTNDENEEPTYYEVQKHCQKKPVEDSLAASFEQKKNAEVLDVVVLFGQKTIPLKHVWRKSNFHHLDGTATKAFHPRTGLPLLSSPAPERKTQTGCFDLDASLLHLKCFSSKSPQRCISKENDSDIHEKALLSSSAPSVTSLSLLGNFEESVLNYRLDPLGIVDGFTAEVGASGIFCPTHMTLPVEVSFYSVSEDNAPSPYMGVIALESLGKRGYRVPPSGTIQVTLFNPNKTVVKMFVVIYDLRAMPANHQTFLRQRTFSVPVKRETKKSIIKENTRHTEERLLRYLIHLRFQSSKSGKIYLYRDVRLLFSRKSMEVDSGAAYELKSYTESPMNPQFSPRC